MLEKWPDVSEIGLLAEQFEWVRSDVDDLPLALWRELLMEAHDDYMWVGS